MYKTNRDFKSEALQSIFSKLSDNNPIIRFYNLDTLPVRSSRIDRPSTDEIPQSNLAVTVTGINYGVSADDITISGDTVDDTDYGYYLFSDWASAEPYADSVHLEVTVESTSGADEVYNYISLELNDGTLVMQGATPSERTLVNATPESFTIVIKL